MSHRGCRNPDYYVEMPPRLPRRRRGGFQYVAERADVFPTTKLSRRAGC